MSTLVGTFLSPDPGYCAQQHPNRHCRFIVVFRRLGSYFSGQITRPYIDYCSFLNKSWKMSWVQVRPRAYQRCDLRQQACGVEIGLIHLLRTSKPSADR
jgi:hypothetical protein